MRAVLFDLDDTILNYSDGVEECWAAACRDHAPDGLDAEDLRQAIYAARRWFWDDPERHRRERTDMLAAYTKIVAAAFAVLEKNGSAAAGAARATGLSRQIAQAFNAARFELVVPLPGAVELLERLHARGVPLGLVTNGDAVQQRAKIERHGLARFFGAVVIEGEFGAGKPDAAVFEHALNELGAKAEDSWMVGDHPEFDVNGARALGLRAVWVDRFKRIFPGTLPHSPDKVVQSLAELDGWVLK